MSKNKKEMKGRREEQKANRLIVKICIGLVVLTLLMIGLTLSA